MTKGPGFNVPLFQMGTYSEVSRNGILIKHNHRSINGQLVDGCPKCEALKISLARSQKTPPENPN